MFSHSGIIPPLEIIRSKNAIDLRIYLEICLLAPENGEPFNLPNRDELSKLCGCGNNVLSESLARLSKTDFFKICNSPEGKKIRRRVVVKVIKLGEILNIHESFIEPDPKIKERSHMGKKNIIPKISDELKSLHLKTKNIDLNNHTLSYYTLDELFNVAGYPTEDDMAIAIYEVDHFRPRAGSIANILECFRSRFEKNNSGLTNGKLKATRLNKISNSPLIKIRQVVALSERLDEQKKSSPIFPTEIYNAKMIDDICRKLNSDQIVLRGEIPIQMTQLSFLKFNLDEVTLGDGVKQLAKVCSGYWKPVWMEILVGKG